MNVPDTAEAIRTMKIRGAGRIARAASSALSEFASGFEGTDVKVFLSEVAEQKDILLRSRPTAVSLRNGVYLTLKGIGKSDTVEELRERIVFNSKTFLASSQLSVSSIAEYGSELIEDGDVVLTHCNSSVAVGVIVKAFKDGKKFKAYATESRPWGQGFITVTELAEAGVDVTLIIDSAVTSVMKDVTKIFVGADTITPDGDLYNKIGTAQIALIAKSMDKPVYVCAETYKISPVYRKDKVVIEERNRREIVGDRELPKDVKVFNPVFDRTESKYIKCIITEEGLVDPKHIRELSIKKFGNKEE